jgi:two-component system response regulator AtoC
MLDVLLVDDKEFELESLSLLLEDEGYRVTGFSRPQEALDYLVSRRVDVIVTDLQMPGMDGIELTRRALDLYADMEVILVTAYASIETAVQAMKDGASHYIVKSPKMGEELLVMLKKVAEQTALRRRVEELEGEAGTEERLGGLVGRSAAMRRVFELIRSVAPHDTTVLIRGETGTGKGVAAAAIHALSPRKDRPMVTVDCAALPQTLLESELFGHAKGAFTGAHADKEGKVKVASDSTLFLDEIGELPVESQPKLLRLLEERTFSPVGSNKVLRSDARVVACTNRDLERMVQEGRFRLDLFHRLNVLTITMPPLRERREDVGILAEYLMKRVAARLNVTPKAFSKEALAAVSRFDWPGNVRQLVHALERSLVIGKAKEVVVEDLPPDLCGGTAPDAEAGDSLLDNERKLVERVLRETDWNIHEASRRLEISRPTLYSKIKKFNLTREGDA